MDCSKVRRKSVDSIAGLKKGSSMAKAQLGRKINVQISQEGRIEKGNCLHFSYEAWGREGEPPYFGEIFNNQPNSGEILALVGQQCW